MDEVHETTEPTSDGPDRGQTQQAFYRILSVTRQLPSPPEVCLAVTRAAQDERTSLADLQRLIESDIALTAKLMQVANSAFFGVRERVTSVSRAILLLGFGTVKTLALGFFLNGEFGKLTLKGLPYPDLPRYALASSCFAQAVARRVAPDLVEGAASLALLHESGTIVMAMAFGPAYRRLLADLPTTHLPLHEAERRTFGLDHAAAGQLLLTNWRLPEGLAQAVGCHHQTTWTGEAGGSAGLLWRVLALAHRGGQLFFESAARQSARELRELAESFFGWQQSQLVEVLQAAAGDYRTRAAIFDLASELTEADCAAAQQACATLRDQARALLDPTA